MSRQSLLAEAKAKNIRGYSRMTKAELEKILAPASPIPAGGLAGEASDGPSSSSSEPSSASESFSSSAESSSSSAESSSSSAESSGEELVKDETLSERISRINILDLKKMCKESGIKISKYDAEKKKSKPKTRAELVQELEAYCLGESSQSCGRPSRPEGSREGPADPKESKADAPDADKVKQEELQTKAI